MSRENIINNQDEGQNVVYQVMNQNLGYKHFSIIQDVLPSFDPVKNDLKINHWIEKIEEFGELYDWDEVTIKHYALAKLHGVAKTWRDSLPCENRSWNEWKDLLEETFTVEASDIDLRLQAQNYKWKPNQDIE